MKQYIVVFVFLINIVKVLSAVDGAEQLEEALIRIERLRSQYSPPASIYNRRNIDNNLYIPQYDSSKEDYENIFNRPAFVHPILSDEILPLLETSAEKGNHEASILLGDFYTFGNFSLPVNYSKAYSYYRHAVQLKANGHAYFMLGFFYATGAFGELELDQHKANLYFEFGAANDDVNSILALAYRNLHGVGTSISCEKALYYYTRVAHIGMDLLRKNGVTPDILPIYNIRLPDFNGGLYGNQVSESPLTIFSTSQFYHRKKNLLNQYTIDVDHEFIDFFFDALKYYYGDIFLPANSTKALEILHDCIEYGNMMFHSKNYYTNNFNMDFLGQCNAFLGHMYLIGYGAEKDYNKALHYLEASTKIKNTSEALNDLGVLYASDMAPSGRDQVKAARYLNRAAKMGYNEAFLNIAKLLMNNSDTNYLNNPYRDKIFDNIQKGVSAGNVECLFYYAEFFQSGIVKDIHPEKRYNCENIVIYYKKFVEKLEPFFFPHLRYAVEELKQGNFKNTLLGYLIAAEQGAANAQVSSAYLLYQTQPFRSSYKRKTFTSDRIKAAIKYLEKASLGNDIDSTVLLGDLYLNGVEGSNFEKDQNKAFNYYKKAELQYSSHGCYNIGYMFEYGLGPANKTVDYFMAKRYYDLSLKYQELSYRNKVPINLALLRLRLKYLFNRKSIDDHESHDESSGWLNAFNNMKAEYYDSNDDLNQEEAREKARAHHEGTLYDYDDEEYDVGDYLVLFITCSFFLIIFVQNIMQRIRRWRNANNNNENNENNANNGINGIDGNPQNANDQVNARFGFNIGGANVEFHFFAI